MKNILLFAIAGALFGSPQPPSFRLPSDAIPVRYLLDLTLDPAKETFPGSITIELNVRKETSVLWLNATQLSIASASVEQAGSTRTAKVLPGGEDYAGFEVDKPLATGSARLRIEFSGKVNLSGAAGVFLDKHNADRYLFTQFESTDARTAFPCFDEPGYKTPWQVTLHVPQGQAAISNTAIQREENEGATKKIVFSETKPLPSYLVAFAVGPLEFVDAGQCCRKKVPVRIVTPRGEGARAKYAAEVTAEILTRLEEYFDIPYPFEKADQLSYPQSFGGAMENPGLVTYSSDIVLAPPQGDDTLARQRLYAGIAAHELAHQWFGDFVTMAWWNDTWLNESFADFTQHKILSTWKPEWETKAEDQKDRTAALWLDRLQTARRIDQPIGTKSDIVNAFDGITYQKGAAVLGMFDQSMGAEKFRQAVRLYLNRHAYGNGTAQDFLDALREMGGPQVESSFQTFLKQAGAPELSMSLKCDGDKARVDISQQRFQPLGTSGGDAQMWKVPVCIAYDKNGARKTQCAAVDSKTQSVPLASGGCPAWFLGNADEAGYYYTKYEGPALEKLVTNRAKLSLAEQAGLFGESFNMLRAGRLQPSESLKLAVQLKDDPRRQIVDAAVQLAGVRLNLLPENLRPAYARYVEENFGARARKLGWVPGRNDSEDDQLIRPQLVAFVASEGEDPALIASAKELVQKWLNTRAALPAETIDGIFKVAARNGDAALHEQILAALKKEKDEFFLQVLFTALGSFRDKALVEENLRLLAAGEFDWRFAFRVAFGPLSTPDLERLPVETVKSNYDAIIAKMPQGTLSFGRLLPQTAAMGCSAREAQEAQAFFAPRMAKVDGGPRELAHVVEQINLCEARKKSQQPDLVQFFQGQ